MSTCAWLDPLRRALDQAARPVTFFFRDDDAGWADAALYHLLDRFAAQRVPLDLAVIPKAVSDPLAVQLRRRCDDQPGLLGLHQHGFRHVNHEAAGRKYEFGPSRSGDQQRQDLQAGDQRLRALFGRRLDSIFTPPWNRCTDLTVRCLSELGYRALSRDASAQPLALPPASNAALRECPVSVDWQRRCGGRRIGRGAIGRQLAEAARAAQPVGVMLHHAVMSEDDFADVQGLLLVLSEHQRARCRRMRELIVVPPPSDERAT